MNIKKIQISENEIYDIGVEIQNVEGLQDYELITVDDIDEICGTTIQVANEEGVTF